MQIDSQSAGGLILIRFGQILKENILFGKINQNGSETASGKKNSKLIPVNSGEFRWDLFFNSDSPQRFRKTCDLEMCNPFSDPSGPLARTTIAKPKNKNCEKKQSEKVNIYKV